MCSSVGAQSASEAALLCIGRSRHAGERVVVGRRRHYERPGERDVRHRLLPSVRGAPERAEGGADSVRVRVVSLMICDTVSLLMSLLDTFMEPVRPKGVVGEGGMTRASVMVWCRHRRAPS